MFLDGTGPSSLPEEEAVEVLQHLSRRKSHTANEDKLLSHHVVMKK
jgi:hypothetical protein